MKDQNNLEQSSYSQVLLQFPHQLEYAKTLVKSFEAKNTFSRIVFVGMGGSGFVGDFFASYLSDISIPVHCLKSYDAPTYIQSDSLVFIISYSGNTDETLEVYRRLMQRKVTAVSISCGGKLEQLAHMYDNMYIKIPSGIQPRQATGYFIPPILKVLELAEIIPSHDDVLQRTIQSLKKDIFENYAKDLVEKVRGTTPVMYGASSFSPIAYAWKTHLNETPKIPAFYNIIPECLHNEISVYETEVAKTQFSYLVLFDAFEKDKRILKKIHSFYDLLKTQHLICQEIVIKGDSRLSQMLSALYLGMWFAYYMAKDRGVDPTSIPIIESFKQKTK